MIELSSRIRPARAIVGMSAVLLPFTADGDIDWAGFEAHLGRTVEAGLIPAVNMDTGFGPSLSPAERTRVLDVTAPRPPTRSWLGRWSTMSPAAPFDPDAYARAMTAIAEDGGTAHHLPVLRPGRRARR